MIYVFYFFAVVLVFLGWQSLRGGLFYLDYFGKELAAPPSDYAPFCSIIAPCRGLDENLRENLAALYRQDFPRFEIVFVVDDERDAAAAVIKKLIAEEISDNAAKKNSPPPISAKVVVAGQATDESQKIRNLRQAVLKVSDASEIFVFVDSDARPAAQWLRNLVAPLANEKIGAATGYRWFICPRINLAAELRSVWNASVASALGANSAKNFCWGGSTAIRRETFERLDVRENWRGTLSDDFALTRVLKAAQLPIYFVPQCLTATVENCTFGEMLEFTTRQMKITRVYSGDLWKASLLGSVVFSAVFWTGIALLFALSGVHFWLTLLSVAVIYALGAGKAVLRVRAVKLILNDVYRAELNRQFLTHSILWAFTPLIFFYNSICALFSRKISWRGIEYKLKSATETVILSTNKS